MSVTRWSDCCAGRYRAVQQHPLAQRLRPDPELGPERVGHHPRRAVLIESIKSHPGRALVLLSGVPLGHDRHRVLRRRS
jgi:hypothetical protein